MENRIQPRDIYPIYKFDIELQFPLFFDIFLKNYVKVTVIHKKIRENSFTD